MRVIYPGVLLIVQCLAFLLSDWLTEMLKTSEE